MTASAATSGYGVTFKKGSTAIAEVVRVSGLGINRETIEVTHLTSDSGWKEFILGLLEGTDITIELNYIPQGATQKAIMTDIIAKTSATYNIVLPDATSTFSMTLLPMSFNVGDIDAGGKLSASAGFKVTGAVTCPT